MRPRFSLIFFLALAVLIVSGGAAEAATRTWDGGGGADTNWNTAANWSSNSIPGSSDTARFDNSSSNNCTINVNIDVQGIDIRSTYTGTITQSSGKTVTVGTADFSQAGGTFTGGDSTIDCNDRFTLSGGTFTATSGTLFVDDNFTVSGGTFTHNSGTVTLDGGGATASIGSAILNHLTLVKGSNDLAVTGTLDVNGNLTITSVGQINTGTISVAVDVTTSDTAVTGSGTIQFDGTGGQTLAAGGGTGQLPKVTVNKSGGTLTIQDTIGVTGGWTYTAGTVDSGTSTVQFATSAQTVNSGAMSFKNVEIATGTNNLTVTGTMDVNGNLTITSVGSINTGTITIAGNLTTTDTAVAGTAGITLDGTGSQTLGADGGTGQLPRLTINKSGGTLTIQDTIESVGNWTYTAGTVNAGTSTVRFATNAVTVSSGTMVFNNVAIATGGNNLIVTGTMDVNGNLTITSVGNINTGTITVAGNLTSNDTSLGGTGTIKLDGTGTQTISAAAGGQIPIIAIDKSAGTAQLGSTGTFVSTFTITNGTFSQGASFNLTVTGATTVAAGGVFTNTGTGDLTLGGNVSNSGIISFDANGGGSGADDILIRSTAVTQRTWSGAGTFTMVDVDVQRQGVGATPGIITVISGTDSGNNTNWSFGQAAPVLYLKLDDGGGLTAADSSGNGFNGTLLGGALWSSATHAPLTVSDPYSVSFDGVDDSVSVTSAALLNPGLSFTISGWVYPNATASGILLAKWNTTGNARQYSLDLSSNKLRFQVSTNGQSGTIRSVTSSGNVTAGIWTHVAAVYAGDEMHVYIDGTKTSSTGLSTSSAFSSTPALRLARDEQGTFLNGFIDEVRLYNIPLSDAEISALAQRDSTPPSKPLNLILAANADKTQITATVTAPSDSDVSELIWRYTAVDGDTTPSYPSTPTSGTSLGDGVTTDVTPSSNQTKIQGSLAQLKTYGVAVWAKDVAGNISAEAAKASLYLSPPSPRLVITPATGESSIEAGSTKMFVVTAKDSSNNTITGYSGPYTLTWTPTGGSALTIVSASASGWVNGAVTVSVTIGGSNAGKGTFLAADNSSNNLQSGSLPYTWYPALFTVGSVPEETLTSGSPFNLIITAKDLSGAVVSRYAGTAELAMIYQLPVTGTLKLSKKAVVPADFVSGIARVSVNYIDAGKVKIEAKDTTYVPTKTISGTSNTLTFFPASFGVKMSSLPLRLSKVYVGQPFSVTVQAFAADGTTITPNYNGTVTVSGLGVTMESRTAIFSPSADKGTHIFESMTASSTGTAVVEAKAGSVSGKSDPMGVRAGLLVINPASASPPGTVQTTAFILDSETGSVVSDDDSTLFILVLGTPTAGTAAASPAASAPAKMASGVVPISVSKQDAGEVTVSASVVGFSMPVTPAVLRWTTGGRRTGTGLKVLQFEQRPGRWGKFQTPPLRSKGQEKLPPSFQKLEQSGSFTKGGTPYDSGVSSGQPLAVPTQGQAPAEGFLKGEFPEGFNSPEWEQQQLEEEKELMDGKAEGNSEK